MLTLAAILVGIGVLLGINMFQENAAQANLDAVIQRSLTLGAQAQAWYKRPVAMGGGGQNFTLNGGFTLQDLGFASVTDSTSDGEFVVQGQTLTTCQILGTGVEDLDGDGNPLTVLVTVSGTGAAVTAVSK